MYKITLNICRGRLRKRRASEKLVQTLKTLFRIDNKMNFHPEDLIIQNEVDTTIWQAIHTLPEKQRLTVILRYYHALPISEIAQVLQVSERTVHTRMHQAHTRLHVMLVGKVK
jgi:RNA polymerase sigma-70 factor, ECF subfamily